jgi:hypothetical protein
MKRYNFTEVYSECEGWEAKAIKDDNGEFIKVSELRELLKKRLRSNINRKIYENEGKDVRYGKVKEDAWLLAELGK